MSTPVRTWEDIAFFPGVGGLGRGRENEFAHLPRSQESERGRLGVGVSTVPYSGLPKEVALEEFVGTDLNPSKVHSVWALKQLGMASTIDQS